MTEISDRAINAANWVIKDRIGVALTRDDMRRALAAALPELVSLHEVPNGWKLVPVEPTEKMLAYGEGYVDFILPDAVGENTPAGRCAELAIAYRQMLKHAPEPPHLIADQEGEKS